MQSLSIVQTPFGARRRTLQILGCAFVCVLPMPASRTGAAATDAGADRGPFLSHETAFGPRRRSDAGRRSSAARTGDPAVFLGARPRSRWLPSSGRNRRAVAMRRVRAVSPCWRRRVAARRWLPGLWRGHDRWRWPLCVQDHPPGCLLRPRAASASQAAYSRRSDTNHADLYRGRRDRRRSGTRIYVCRSAATIDDDSSRRRQDAKAAPSRDAFDIVMP